jgi:UDP-glucose 4-epimerase
MLDAQTNILGTINMIQLANSCNECHFILASTSAVYDDTGTLPYNEDDDLSPHLPYGIAKASAEMYVANLCPSYSILRYGNVYGERQVEIGENQLVPHAIRFLLDDFPFNINGDGESFRDFIYAGDIARANIIACEKKVNGVFNIGTGQDTTVNRVWNILNGLNSKDESGIGKFVEHGEAKEGEARGVSLSVDRAWRELGFRAETNVSEGLKKTMESWRNEREFYK